MKYLYVFLFYPFFLFSQSEFINKNHLGFNANIARFQNNIFNGAGASFGISIRGLVDIGVEHISSSFDDEFSEFDVESNSNMIYMGYNIKKNNFSNLKFSLGYLFNTMERKNYSPINISGLLFSIIFSYRIFESEAITLMPGLGFTYGLLSESQIRFNILSDNSFYEDFDNSRRLTLSFSLILKPVKGFHLIFSPSIAKILEHSDNSLVIGLNGGIMFSFAND